MLEVVLTATVEEPRAQPQIRGGGRSGHMAGHGKCENITIPMCTNIAYNQTILPNLLGHSKQEEAGMEIHQFYPLVKVQCSPHLQIFLCLVYAPVCTILEDALPPCRSLCLAAKDGCEELMIKFGYPWPQNLACDNFPTAGPDQLCVEDTESMPGGNRGNIMNEERRIGETYLGSPRGYLPDNYLGVPRGLDGPQHTLLGGDNTGMEFICPKQLKVDPELEYKLTVGDKTVLDCGAPCDQMFFTQGQRQFSRFWVGLSSVVCLLSCAFTILSFVIDCSRFPYPERPIIYLSACYACIALGYVVGFAVGDSIACSDRPEQVTNGGYLPERTIRQGGMQDWRCTILFMIIYFFGMAGSIWWLILTVCWFLSASLKWGQEAIDAQSQWFHVIAWAKPTIMTVTLVVLKKPEGDILTGVCYVGLWDVWSLRWFVLAPFLVYLTIGTIFLMLGLFSLIKIRTVMKQDGSKTDKLEKLIIRIGIFSVLYTVPMTIIIACLFYEQHYFSSWMIQWQERLCLDPHFKRHWAIPCPSPRPGHDVPLPDFTVYMIKYLMVLIIGTVSGFWVWTEKTIQTWCKFFVRLCRVRPEAHV